MKLILRNIVFALGFLLLFVLNEENSVSCWCPWKWLKQKVKKEAIKEAKVEAPRFVPTIPVITAEEVRAIVSKLERTAH